MIRLQPTTQPSTQPKSSKPLCKQGVKSDGDHSKQILWNIVSAIIFPIGLTRAVIFGLKRLANDAILPMSGYRGHAYFRKMMLEERQKIIDEAPDLNSCHEIETDDGVKLDTLELQQPHQKELAANEQKWVIFLNPNNAVYQKRLSLAKELGAATGANVYLGNYRGTGLSEGIALNSQELHLDAEAMVQHLLAKGVRAENIVLYGFSIGGALAAAAAARHKGMHLVSDRSFTTLKDLLIEAIPLGRLVAVFASLVGWSFDAASDYAKITGRKVILYHKLDRAIIYRASLYRRIKESVLGPRTAALEESGHNSRQARQLAKKQGDYKPESIRLRDYDHGDAIHGKPLNHQTQAPLVYAKIKEILDLP